MRKGQYGCMNRGFSRWGRGKLEREGLVLKTKPGSTPVLTLGEIVRKALGKLRSQVGRVKGEALGKLRSQNNVSNDRV